MTERVIVVGGGIAGLTVAYFLRRGGAEVTVVDRGPIGGGASAGNAGWVCPAQAGPLPEPGLTAYGLRSLVQRDAPLYFAPGYLPRMVPWLVRFARHCNAADHRSGMRALAALGRRAFALTEALAADGVAFDLSRDGLLVAAEDPGAATAFLDGLAPLRELGFDLPQRPFDGDAARELEPALSGAVRAGLVIDDHWTVDPATLTAGLAARLRERGVTLHEHAAVTGFGTHHAAAHEVLTTAGPHVADAVVLAAGAWTPGLARTLGLRVPIRPGKGYSFELPLPAALNRPLMLLDAHVGCTPFRNRLRIAGTMEFSGVNTRLDRRRIDAIVRTAARTLPLAAAHAIERPWTGMRPIAPDGLPIVDRSPRHPNVYLATGYSMLGMTLGAPAGEALAQMILTGQRPSELEPFRADR